MNYLYKNAFNSLKSVSSQSGFNKLVRNASRFRLENVHSKYAGLAENNNSALCNLRRPASFGQAAYTKFGLLSRAFLFESSVKATASPDTGSRYFSAQTVIRTKKKMAKLTEQERAEQLQPLLNAGWTMVNGRDAIYKEYLFTDFNGAFSFMAGAALLAEKMNHHPEWFNVYNKVQVTMSTHDVGGLSAKDIRMANYMEEHAKRFL